MNKVLVVGSGYMAGEYLKVLDSLKFDVVVVGRGTAKVDKLKSEYPQFDFHSGGIEEFVASGGEIPTVAINTSTITQLKSSSICLLGAGVKKILIEKPGDIFIEGISQLNEIARKANASVYIAYNRRFYTSVLQLQKELNEDGGAIGTHFEFSEWIHTIDPGTFDVDSLSRWIMSNSSHVIDTVFHLIGLPSQLHAIVKEQDQIEWHRSGSVFFGCGVSEKDIPFTYHSNWNAPGRWAIEIWTRKRRFYLKPMEKLAVQLKGSVSINEFPINDSIDTEFKPGLFLQTKNFMEGKLDEFCTIEEQHLNMQKIYSKISGYPA